MATVHGVQAGSDLSNTTVTWIAATATALLVFAVALPLPDPRWSTPGGGVTLLPG